MVHDHDVAGLEGRRQGRLDIGEEAFAVDRAVEDARGGDPVVAERGEEGRGLPVAVGDGGDDPLTAPGPAVAARHVGRGPGLVDEHQAFRADRRLSLPPGDPRSSDVRALLLGRVLGLFFRVRRSATRNRLSAAGLTSAPSAASRVRSSARVTSGSAAIRARTRSAWTSSVERFQPPYRSGSTEPIRLKRCISLITKLVLTLNRPASLAAMPPLQPRPPPAA